VVRFLLTAGAIGVIYKETASIWSQSRLPGRGRVSCSMAAAGLAEVFGGTPAQVENAAEIAMEHNLGLTCSPVGGLVQVPCIERTRWPRSRRSTPPGWPCPATATHVVSLDKVIKTMRPTGADMEDKYQETARRGLAVNVVEC
jgi:L-serine dehydratase